MSLATFTNVPGTAATAGAPNAEERRILGRLTLGPGETTTVESVFKFEGVDGESISDPAQPGDLSLTRQLGYCLLPDPDADCPDEAAYPQLVGYARPITITVKPHDLGDAPDSSNHAGVQMLAYPGVPARYPDGVRPGAGQPQGPSHGKPKPFHLGQRVSLEVEADQGLDQDPSTNIVPATNTPNRDRFDDGANPSAWPLVGCQPAVVPVRVFVSPAAAAWFAGQGAPAYINIWVDGNRDGDWGDGTTCPSGAVALEHLTIDHPVNVAALGAGLHTINVPTGPAPFPANLANQPAWVRVTLSEAKSVKPLTTGGIAYGDGRGPAQGFRTGETEDYVLRRDGVPGAGPDLELDMDAQSQRKAKPAGATGGVSASGAAPSMGEPMTFDFDLSIVNRGDRTASGGQLQFTIPPTAARPARQDPSRARGRAIPCPTESVLVQLRRRSWLRLPDIRARRAQRHRAWAGTAASPAPLRLPRRPRRTTRHRQAHPRGRRRPTNNEATATARTAPRPPTIGQFMDYTDDAVLALAAWGQRHHQPHRSSAGRSGRAGQHRADHRGWQAGGDGDGRRGRDLHVPCQPGRRTAPDFRALPRAGRGGQIGQFDIQMLRLRVAPNLPFDPVTLTFTDAQGRVLRPNAKGGGEVAMEELHLVAGMTYQVGVNLTPGSLQDPASQSISRSRMTRPTSATRTGMAATPANLPTAPGAISPRRGRPDHATHGVGWQGRA